MLLKDELTAFLDARGASDFVAYLDPVNEPLSVALERRLTWAAERTAGDNQSAGEEAKWLFDNADALRTLVQFGLFGVKEPEFSPDDETEALVRDVYEVGVEDEFSEDADTDGDEVTEQMDFVGLTRMEDLTNPPTPPRNRPEFTSFGLLKQGDEVLDDIRLRNDPAERGVPVVPPLEMPEPQTVPTEGTALPRTVSPEASSKVVSPTATPDPPAAEDRSGSRSGLDLVLVGAAVLALVGYWLLR
jgi:hypothetical protein